MREREWGGKCNLPWNAKGARPLAASASDGLGVG